MRTPNENKAQPANKFIVPLNNSALEDQVEMANDSIIENNYPVECTETSEAVVAMHECDAPFEESKQEESRRESKEVADLLRHAHNAAD